MQPLSSYILIAACNVVLEQRIITRAGYVSNVVERVTAEDLVLR